MSVTPASADLNDWLIARDYSTLPFPIAVHAFMVALAAFQRGLQVTFHYDLSWHPRFAHLVMQGGRGELFSVSDGQKTHYFRRTQGDLITREASAKAENKQTTKAILHQVGILVPPGLVVRTGQEPEIETLLARYPQFSYLLKPLDGSLGEGVMRDLSQSALREILPTLTKAHLLEVYLKGREFRVYVVGDRCVSAFERVPAHVVGDGQRTIGALVEAKNALRAQHPVYREHLIEQTAELEAFLARKNLTLASVPAQGEGVFLNAIPAVRDGGDLHEIVLSSSAQAQAVAAAKALDLPVTGLDMMILNFGQADEQAFILELNQCPYLNGQIASLTRQTPAYNRVGEAMMDFYFPDSRQRARWPKASFDMGRVVNLLSSGAAARIDLPCIQDDWLHHQSTLQGEQASDAFAQFLLGAWLQKGLHGRLVRQTQEQLLMDLLGPQDKIADLRSAFKLP